jgi:class 3 adenylate cyclase/tetratricopeptide (TPR) repeat protein
MGEIEDIERVIAALESQRGQLGDRIVDTALAPLREKMQALQAIESQNQQQLKYVSALFMDVVGSTRMGQHLDPEDNMAIMTAALERFSEIIQQHGGRVTRFMGDGLKAIFGIQTTSEDDAERAVKAGLALIMSAREYAPQVEETWQVSGFNIRVGVNTGQILIGGGVEDENTVAGMAINLAARMESAAPVGGVLISENTYRHVRGKFEMLAQPPMFVKGIEEPVRTYQVLRMSPQPFHAKGRGIQGVSTVLIGREDELARLKESFQALQESSHSRLITIMGEAGVGKSRLLAEFESWMAQQPGQVNCYRGRATPQTIASPYGLLRELLAGAFNVLDSDTAEQAHERLESGLARYLNDEAEMKSHFIVALLGYDYSASPYLSGVLGDFQQINQRGLFYLGQYFENVVQEAPAMILLEDIHWGDWPSLEFIQQMVGSLSGAPLLVICLARRLLLENHPQWERGDSLKDADYLRIELHSLSATESRELVRAILDRVRRLPASLMDLITKQAEGNPYYIEELINVLIDDGVIVTGNGQQAWEINSSRLEAVRVPATLTSVLQARLDGLPNPEKKVLQRAAIIGRTFWDQPLQIMNSSPAAPDTAIDALTKRGLIDTKSRSIFQGAKEYAFRQSLMREVTYNTVLKSDRKRYHASVAAWLCEVTQSSGRSEEYLSVIAEHYDRAGDPDRASEWYLRAGERAKSQGALRQARRFYDRAMDLLPETDQERRWRALLGRDEVLGLLGEVVARQADDQALLAMAQVSGDAHWLAKAYYRLAYSADDRGDAQAALLDYQAAISAARSCSDLNLVVEMLALSAIDYIRLGDIERAGKAAEEALDLVQQIDDNVTRAKVYTNIAGYYSEIGNLSRALELLREQVKTTHRLGHRVGEAIGLSNLGYGYAQLGEYDLAETALEESTRISQAIGARRHFAIGQLNLALVYWRTDRCTAAIPLIEQAIQDLSGVGDQFGCGAGMIYLGLNQESCHDYSNAMNSFSKARDILDARGMTGLVNDALAGMARCAMASDQLVLARRNAELLWSHLQESRGAGMEFPILGFMTCEDVFSAVHEDRQAQAAIQIGHQELIDRAARISHPSWRDIYLNKVPERVQITTRWEHAGQQSDQ